MYHQDSNTSLSKLSKSYSFRVEGSILISDQWSWGSSREVVQVCALSNIASNYVALLVKKKSCGRGMPRTSFEGGLWGNFCKEGAPGYERSKVFGLKLFVLVYDILRKLIIDILRKFDQTPGTYPRPSTTSIWRKSFHICILGHLEYVPGVCWNFLRHIWQCG